MHLLGYVLIILLSGLTGALSIWVFFKLLFRPVKPFKLGGLSIQGVLPKHQDEIADNIGEIVNKEMQLADQLGNKLSDPGNFQKLMPEIEGHIDDFLRNKLNKVFPILSNFIGDKTINQLKGAFMEELEQMFPSLLKSYAANLQNDLNIEKLVSEKIKGISTSELEKLIYENASGKINAFIAGGYLLGCTIGLIQAFIAYALIS